MKGISILAMLLLPSLLLAQKCVQGDCKNGYGVLRINAAVDKGAVYRVGNFANGQLEGEGMEVSFHQSLSSGNHTQYSEADFLLLTAYGNPGFKDVKALNPQVIKSGIFKNGELTGKGILYAIESEKIPELYWITEFGKRFAFAKSWKELRYEGEFLNTRPAGRGQVILLTSYGKVTTTGENLTSPTNPDVVFELEREGLAGKGLFRGSFKYGFAHGWALTNLVKNQITEGGKLVRQLWHYNWPGNTTEPGIYPFDEAGSREYNPDHSSRYIVGLDDKGKPSGFGRLVKLNYPGDTAYVYTGYFSAGKPSGEGFLERKNGEWKAGTFNTLDTLLSGVAAFHEGGLYRVYSGTSLFPDGHIRDWSGLYLCYRSASDYALNQNIIEQYSGNWKEGRYHGYGIFTATNLEKKGQWSYGLLVSGQALANTKQLSENTVIVIDGIASPIKRKSTGYGWVTADNRPVPEGQVTISKLPISSFFGACAICNGSGKQSEAHYIPPSSKLDVKTVTTYTDASYVGGYWKNTSKVVTETTSGGYTYYTHKTCGSCYGGKNVLNVKSLPEP